MSPSRKHCTMFFRHVELRVCLRRENKSKWDCLSFKLFIKNNDLRDFFVDKKILKRDYVINPLTREFS